MSQPEITIDWDGDPTSVITVYVVWHRPIPYITVPIEFIPYEPNNRKPDDPV
jgi:hypothetical protein